MTLTREDAEDDVQEAFQLAFGLLASAIG
jgi:hypothetical protein